MSEQELELSVPASSSVANKEQAVFPKQAGSQGPGALKGKAQWQEAGQDLPGGVLATSAPPLQEMASRFLAQPSVPSSSLAMVSSDLLKRNNFSLISQLLQISIKSRFPSVAGQPLQPQTSLLSAAHHKRYFSSWDNSVFPPQHPAALLVLECCLFFLLCPSSSSLSFMVSA